MTRIIKTGGPGERSASIIEGAVFDAKVEAERIVAEARAEAARLLEAARAEAERLASQAVTEGRERGLAAVSELLVGARAAAANARTGAQLELRTLAVRIAQKIIGRELKGDPDTVVDVTAEAMTHMGEVGEVLVRANPADLAALERGRPRLLERCRATAVLSFRPDERIERGGCIVETELGVIDARLSVQLDAIERALKAEGA